jgi:hypothetical protein
MQWKEKAMPNWETAMEKTPLFSTRKDISASRNDGKSLFIPYNLFQ